MLCVKFGWNWPSGSGEADENVKNLRQCSGELKSIINFANKDLGYMSSMNKIVPNYK